MIALNEIQQQELELEKAKEKYKHKLELWRKGMDKGLLALVVALFGYFLNVGIENYKNDLSEKRFLLESRLTTLKNLRSAYDDVANYTYKLANVDETKRQEITTAYESSLHEFVRIANRSNLLFSANFDQRINQHVWFHLGVISDGSQFTSDKWPFAVDVFFDFDDLTRSALWEEAFGFSSKPATGKFKLIDWDSKKYLAKSAREFFEENFKAWRVKNPR